MDLEHGSLRFCRRCRLQLYTTDLNPNKPMLKKMSENSSMCRWAFLGLSAIAENFIADILLERPDDDPIAHELVAVSTTDLKERATTWLIDHEVPSASKVALYTSLEEMLAKGDFDIVYVPTPHPLHSYMCGSLSRIRGVSWWKASNIE